VPALPEWADDPTTPEKSELGRLIFFDARLSGSGHTTCDACHGHQVFWQDNLPAATPDRSFPSDTPKLPRNTLSFYNIVHAPVFRWDGSHTDLVDVMVFPFSEANMNLGADVPSAQLGLQKRLTVDLPAYVPLFKTAFGEDLGKLDAPAVWRLTGRALRAFVRKAVSRDSAFDKWNAGDDAAMSDAAVRGIGLFQGKGAVHRLPRRAVPDRLLVSQPLHLAPGRGRRAQGRGALSRHQEGGGSRQVPHAHAAPGLPDGAVFPRRQRALAPQRPGPPQRGHGHRRSQPRSGLRPRPSA